MGELKKGLDSRRKRECFGEGRMTRRREEEEERRRSRRGSREVEERVTAGRMEKRVGLKEEGGR